MRVHRSSVPSIPTKEGEETRREEDLFSVEFGEKCAQRVKIDCGQSMADRWNKLTKEKRGNECWRAGRGGGERLEGFAI